MICEVRRKKNEGPYEMLIETDRLRLRKWQADDSQPFFEMNKDPKIMQFLGPALTRQKSDLAIAQQIELMENNEPAFWAVDRKDDKSFIGCIGVKAVGFEAPFTPCYEIGWRLGAAFWGHGYATEGAKAALKLAFNRWDMHDIYSFTVLKNMRSQSVMKKIGMVRVNEGDFNHPNLAIDDPLSRHVLYRISRAQHR